MAHIQTKNGIAIFGEPIPEAVSQMETVRQSADRAALMADHHLGYSMPIGGVAAYRDHVSPSGVGYDIACGNKAVRIDTGAEFVREHISEIMDEIFSSVSFGIGRKNAEFIEDPLFRDDPAWGISAVSELKELAQSQLGTVGGGNHYVDVFVDELDRVWIGVHFGSRGFGHKIATHYLKAADAKPGINSPPTLIPADSDLGQEYIAAMHLAGRYAYAGRDHVCNHVATLIGGAIEEEVHNHHNFAWREVHDGEEFWVIRKGATPAFPGQYGFVGGSMGEQSVILRGIDSDEARLALYSTIHGSGRVMSRTEARGRSRWKAASQKPGREGKVTREMMMAWVDEAGVELRGGDVDESPHCYKRLEDVLRAHGDSVEIVHRLTPVGVAMAPPGGFDPYAD